MQDGERQPLDRPKQDHGLLHVNGHMNRCLGIGGLQGVGQIHRNHQFGFEDEIGIGQALWLLRGEVQATLTPFRGAILNLC